MTPDRLRLGKGRRFKGQPLPARLIVESEAPRRLRVPAAAPREEARQLAEALADLHYLMGLLVYNGEYFLPGEELDSIRRAWTQSDETMAGVIARLASPSPTVLRRLRNEELLGAPGSAKRRFMARPLSGFMEHWGSEPRTSERVHSASDAALTGLEVGETVCDSLVGIVPGVGVVKEAAGLLRHGLVIRRNRGH